MTSILTLTTFANSLADAARTVSTRYFRQQLDVDHKTADQPVTIADRETEALMRRMIEDKFPDHGIFGEEHGKQDLDRPYVWVIDPIDGTKSFITGMPFFGTLIALMKDGKPILGIVDMPAMQERWVGVAGQPTLFNGTPVKTRACTKLSDAIFYTTSPETFRGPQETKAYTALTSATKLNRFGGDCYPYGLLASGFVDVVLDSQMQPYDFLCLVPVIEGAGGCITDWAGQPLGLDSGPQVLASATATLHKEALGLLAAHITE